MYDEVEGLVYQQNQNLIIINNQNNNIENQIAKGKHEIFKKAKKVEENFPLRLFLIAVVLVLFLLGSIFREDIEFFLTINK